MSSSAERIRAYGGFALFSYGFRPFFLFGAGWAALTMALWLPLLGGYVSLPIAFAPVAWHVHELMFGYVPAVVAGFLLTAVPNWTGRLPIVGSRLAALFGCWLLGRIAILVGVWIGPLAAILDLTFLVALGGVIAREILASGDTRNLKVLAGVALLLVGNVLFHLEAGIGLGDGHGTRIGLAATLLLIMVIGGRIIPSFTRNWLARRQPGPMPVPFSRGDGVVMGISVASLATWVLWPAAGPTAALALASGAVNLWRLHRWAGIRTIREPLVLVLHVGFVFVPVGYLLVALGILWPAHVPPSGALHAWTAGAIGMMTLAVMTRASLGHTGRPLMATPGITAIYAAAFLAALARVSAVVEPIRAPMLIVSAICWVLAFGGFVAIYAPLLARRRERTPAVG